MTAIASGAADITCRHLLVPLDEADHAMATVLGAIQLAGIAAARITFVHIRETPQTENGGDALAPAARPCGTANRRRALTVKAETVARAHGIPCASAAPDAETTDAAILAAAHDAGCDMILIGVPAEGSKQSNRATMRHSLAQAVLALADIPVLILPYPSPFAAMPALRLIRDEHRAVCAVLHAWQDLLTAAEASGIPADLGLMRVMIRFLEAVPVARQRQRRQQVLISRLRRRTCSINAELDELARQCERDAQLRGALGECVEGYAAGNPPGKLVQTLDDYAQLVWARIGREEGVVLHAALRHLTAEDWNDIHGAIGAHPARHHLHHPFAALLACVAGLPEARCVARVCERLDTGINTF